VYTDLKVLHFIKCPEHFFDIATDSNKPDCHSRSISISPLSTQSVADLVLGADLIILFCFCLFFSPDVIVLNRFVFLVGFLDFNANNMHSHTHTRH
jgi:hypothetical protein